MRIHFPLTFPSEHYSCVIWGNSCNAYRFNHPIAVGQNLNAMIRLIDQVSFNVTMSIYYARR